MIAWSDPVTTRYTVIGLFDENKKETRHPIDKITDIYNFSQELIKNIELYEEVE